MDPLMAPQWDAAARRWVRAGVGSWFVKKTPHGTYLRLDLTTVDRELVDELQRLTAGVGRVYARSHGRLSWRLQRQHDVRAFARALVPYLPPGQQLALTQALAQTASRREPTPTPNRALGELLGRCRRLRRLTQSQVARALGRARASSVAHWEQGRRVPTKATLFALQQLYGVPGLLVYANMVREVPTWIRLIGGGLRRTRGRGSRSSTSSTT